MYDQSIEDPIIALASPWGESAIALLRITGKKSLHHLTKVFQGKIPLDQVKGYTLIHGKIINPDDKEVIDDVIIAIYKAPKSYTGENSAEIFCHGSLAIIQTILKILIQNSFRQAGPGEFTMRAYINGKMDLTRAEAVNEIVKARSNRARNLALNRLSGSIEKKIQSIKTRILDILTHIEVNIDYPEEDVDTTENLTLLVEPLINSIKKLLLTYKAGKLIQEGVSIVIAGKTNAGKSTLFNLLLHEDRAIVSEIHGTTRDYIEGSIIIEGLPIRLFDTAGLRKTQHPIEQEGIKRTDQIIKNAHTLLYIIDSQKGISDEDKVFIDTYKDLLNTIVIWNKIDISKKNCPKEYIPFSAEMGSGIEYLNKAIVSGLLDDSVIESGEPVIDSLRQKELLVHCLESLENFDRDYKKGFPLDVLAVCLRDGLDYLGKITGEISTPDILNQMFQNFCVGK